MGREISEYLFRQATIRHFRDGKAGATFDWIPIVNTPKAVERAREQWNFERSTSEAEVSQRFRARAARGNYGVAFESIGGGVPERADGIYQSDSLRSCDERTESFRYRKIEGDGGRRWKLAGITRATLHGFPANAGKSGNITVACRQAARIPSPCWSRPSPPRRMKNSFPPFRGT